MPRFTAAVFACLLVFPPIVSAQRIVAVGDTVRVPGGFLRKAVEGEVDFISPDSVVLRRPDGARQTITRPNRRSPRVLEGRRPAIDHGVLAGVALGGLIGMGIGASIPTQETGGWAGLERVEQASKGMLIGGVVGAAIGIAVGATAKTKRWVRGQFASAPPPSRSAQAGPRPAPIVEVGVESTVLVGIRVR